MILNDEKRKLLYVKESPIQTRWLAVINPDLEVGFAQTFWVLLNFHKKIQNLKNEL